MCGSMAFCLRAACMPHAQRTTAAVRAVLRAARMRKRATVSNAGVAWALPSPHICCVVQVQLPKRAKGSSDDDHKQRIVDAILKRQRGAA